MTNKEALKNLCTAIVSTFYVDSNVLEFALQQAGINPERETDTRDRNLFRVACVLVRGYCESSRSEAGVSVSVNVDAVNKALRYWGRLYDVDVEEFVESRVIDDGSNLW